MISLFHHDRTGTIPGSRASSNQNYYSLICGLSIAAIIPLLLFTGIFNRLEKLLYDWRITHKSTTDVPEIAIIGISTLGRRPFDPKLALIFANFIKTTETINVQAESNYA